MVLVVSGVTKLRDTDPTQQMLKALRLPAGPAVVLAVGLAEIVFGVAAFVIGGLLLSVAVALAYGVFAVVSVRLLRQGGEVGCGCFGTRSTRITGAHVAVNLGSCLVAIAGAAANVPGFVDARADLVWAGLPQLGLIAIGTSFVVTIMTVLPEVATRPTRTA